MGRVFVIGDAQVWVATSVEHIFSSGRRAAISFCVTRHREENGRFTFAMDNTFFHVRSRAVRTRFQSWMQIPLRCVQSVFLIWITVSASAQTAEGNAKLEEPRAGIGLSQEATSDRAVLRQAPPVSMRLRELLDLVLRRNESLQVRLLEVEISRKTHQAEQGIFEPQVVGSLERTDSQRPNNTQQTLNLGFQPRAELKERNTLSYGGLEFLAPAGTRIRTGYTLRELQNNLQGAIDREYETFVGVNILQPLLKNFGPNATLARIRLAALGSDIAFQEYRRHLMILIAQVEAGYWDLYLAQEQERMIGESASLARKVMEDNKTRSELGVSTQLEVMEAEARWRLRRAGKDEASLKVFEEAKQLSGLYADTETRTEVFLRAIDEPQLIQFDLTPFNNYQMAYASNPDYWIRLRQVEQEDVRVKFAKNQRLPQLDLKGSYGLNGLGTSVGSSWDDVPEKENPAWSIGLEMRIPVAGGVKERRELEVAFLSRKRAEMNLKEASSQIANRLDSGIQRARTLLHNVDSYRSVAEFHQKLLEAQLAQLETGRIDTRSVMETEEKLLESRISVVESLVAYRKALLELELIRGSILSARDLELAKAELARATFEGLSQRGWSKQALEQARDRLWK